MSNRKRVVVTVGTSILKNLVLDESEISKDVSSFHSKISSFLKGEGRIRQIKKEQLVKKVKEYWSSKIDLTCRVADNQDKKMYLGDASAEIESLLLFHEKYAEHTLDIVLICTDTDTSRFSAELIVEYFNLLSKKDGFKGKFKIICFNNDECLTRPYLCAKKLNMDKGGSFQTEGIQNLLKALVSGCLGDKYDKEKYKKHRKKISINVSGGYKALIPILTLYAQLGEHEIFYKYEYSDELIFIKNMPISFDVRKLRAYGPFLHQKSPIWSQVEDSKSKEMREHLIDAGLVKDHKGNLTILGVIMGYHSNDRSDQGQIVESLLYRYLSLNQNASTYLECELLTSKMLKTKIDEFYTSYPLIKERLEEPFNLDLDKVFFSKNEALELVKNPEEKENFKQVGDIDLPLLRGNRIVLGEVKGIFSFIGHCGTDAYIRQLEARIKGLLKYKGHLVEAFSGSVPQLEISIIAYDFFAEGFDELLLETESETTNKSLKGEIKDVAIKLSKYFTEELNISHTLSSGKTVKVDITFTVSLLKLIYEINNSRAEYMNVYKLNESNVFFEKILN